MPPLRLSIRAAVLAAIVAAVIAPTALLWSIETRLTRSAHEPLIEQGRRGVLGLTAAALVEPLWTINTPATHATVRSALDDAGVLSLRLTERRPDTPPFEAIRPGAARGQGMLRRTLIIREGEELGELEIWFDPDQLDRLLAQRRQAMLQLAGLQVLLSIGLLLAVLNWRLLKPIARLKDQASRMASREDATPIDWRRRDELGELGQHLNEVHTQIVELFEQSEQQKTDLEKLALHDILTDLPNRLLFRELAQGAVAAAQRDGRKLALLFIDLDRFKAINDTLGHAAGDQVLQTVAQRLRAAARSADVVCRHSGDEFLVLLRDTASVDDIAVMAERLLRAVDAPMHVQDREVSVSASIGIALYPDDSADHEALVCHADTAMYAAKNLGRARYSFFRSEFNTELQSHLAVEQELRRALRNEEFVLHYQPQVAAEDGRLIGCEALIRWQHPERGLVPPLQFIALAEQCGLISDLGAWAVHRACRQMAEWREQGVPFGTVAVNVSAAEFRHHRLIDTVTQAMQAHGVRPEELELEITESVLMTDTDTTQRIVDHLQELGIGLAIDDFGTGYSSLAYLKRLWPGKLKIDRSFMRDLPGDADDRVLVLAIIRLAHALGVGVVAEGVETTEQRAFLRESGCDVLQGYLISRPQPAALFAEFARTLQSRPDDPPEWHAGAGI
jgi:diguanylate cyclase (GGDEF)-like protein